MRVGFEDERDNGFKIFVLFPCLWYSWENKQYIFWLSWGFWCVMLQVWGKQPKKAETKIETI